MGGLRYEGSMLPKLRWVSEVETSTDSEVPPDVSDDIGRMIKMEIGKIAKLNSKKGAHVVHACPKAKRF